MEGRLKKLTTKQLGINVLIYSKISKSYNVFDLFFFQNQKSVFNGSAWEWNDERGAWYLHQFYPQQPDLNLRNEAVVKELEEILKYWMNLGVAGFRMDAVAHMFESESFEDEVQVDGGDLYDSVEHKQTYNLPETLDLLKRFRKVLDEQADLDVADGKDYMPR
jgi:glycosidase